METTSKKLLGSVTISPEVVLEVEKEVKSISTFEEKIKKYISGDTTRL